MKRKKHGKGSFNETLKLVQRTRKGRRAVSRFKRFWFSGGKSSIPAIRMIDVPGVGKTEPYVGLGKSPAIYVADGPKNRHTKIRKIKRRGILVADARGKRLVILSGRTAKGPRKLKRLGYIPQTDYVPFGDVEKSGSFKAGKHWQHSHSDDGGKWPLAHTDQAGNVWYSRGTFTVGKWIRR